MLELMRDAADLVAAGQVWYQAQPLPLQIGVAVGALAVLWVLWILLRVILVAFRATFRGL
ncbi:MAG: hypothetical protein WCA32_19810 [Chromatiaceae bacterium]|jgi:hypothetical protein